MVNTLPNLSNIITVEIMESENEPLSHLLQKKIWKRRSKLFPKIAVQGLMVLVLSFTLLVGTLLKQIFQKRPLGSLMVLQS